MPRRLYKAGVEDDSGGIMLKRLGVVFLAVVWAFPALADAPATVPAGAYPKPTWVSLLQTMIRFNALDMSEDALLDEYALVTQCDLYQSYYKDDFKWQEIRIDLRKSLEQHKDEFLAQYRYETQLQLDRYDFGKKLYKFTDGSKIQHVNVLGLLEVSGEPCEGSETNYIPTQFRAVLDAPITILGLPLPPDKAQELLDYMNASGNSNHIVQARFNLRIVYIEAMHKSANLNAMGSTAYQFQQTGAGDRSVRFDVKLDAIEFYADEAMTKLIYTFKPSVDSLQ